jgi:hypothetical protein
MPQVNDRLFVEAHLLGCILDVSYLPTRENVTRREVNVIYKATQTSQIVRHCLHYTHMAPSIAAHNIRRSGKNLVLLIV